MHLYPVEMRNVDLDDVDKNVGEKDQGVGKRLKRCAAVDVRWKSKAMLDS